MRHLLHTAALAAPVTLASLQAGADVCITNPDWGILVTDHGYSDIMVDLRPEFAGREYLSGEWAAAIHYDQNPLGMPEWLEPDFVFPDWTTNSTFAVVKAVGPTGVTNAFGFPVFDAVIDNGQLRIRMVFEMVDTGSGIAQGVAPASAPGPGTSIPSTRVVLRQTYEITNVSEFDLTNVELYQFLHGLQSLVSIHDDRAYPGPFSAYRHDTTQVGLDFNSSVFDPSSACGVPVGPLPNAAHTDAVSFHSSVAPVDVENGHYGNFAAGDDHQTAKPSVGTHLSIEAGLLNGVDFFDPGDADFPTTVPSFGFTAPDDLWISGVQEYSFGLIAPDQTVTFDVLLSLATETEILPPDPAQVDVPLPPATLFVALAGIGTIASRRPR